MLGRVRLTLTATNVVVVAIVVIALMASAYFVAARVINRDADTELQRTAQLVRGNATRALSGFAGPGFFRDRPESAVIFDGAPSSFRGGLAQAVFFNADGQIVGSPEQTTLHDPITDDVAVALTGKSKIRTISTDSGSYRVVTEPILINGGTVIGAVQLSQSRAVQQQILTTLRNVLLAVGGAGLLFAAGSGYLLAGRAMRPVTTAMERQRSFVADAAHELRTPLAIISANAEALEMSAIPMTNEDTELLTGIRAESGYLAALVTKLLEMAKLEYNSARVPEQSVDIARTVDDACGAMRGLAERKGVRLTWPTLAEPVEVNGDPVLARLVTLSLLDNAIKYNNPGGSVDVRLNLSAREARIEISDTGPGIPADHLSRVFDRFYRVDKARSRETGGVGLGLAIAQRAVNVLKGSLELRSEVGRGTTATVRLTRRHA
jgi:signal transduction histidine kinase